MNIKNFWTVVVQLINSLTLSTVSFFEDTFDVHSGLQIPISKPIGPVKITPVDIVPAVEKYPIFIPPSGPEQTSFRCEYPSLPEYEPCSRHDNRTCWLRPKDPKSGLRVYDIKTDYENFYPQGITRKYYLNVTEATIYPDGCKNAHCKVFVDVTKNPPLNMNKTYPGPWIQACWGDDIEVNVINSLSCNGTTIHWHGIRQLFNVENDGVNAVTQCPIAPGDNFTYKFKALQYGSSWYHSHYALQYADGMAGPMTLHGPSSHPYDHAVDPILITDWNQRSAFEDWSWSLGPKRGRPMMTSVLLNGRGKYIAKPGDTCKPEYQRPHTLIFQKGVRYLIRLINTSVDSTFVFSIDQHNLTVIGMDFVPIEPYTNTSVLIGIGQRYHIVVEANPIGTPEPNGNYWIRTDPAPGCNSIKSQPDTVTPGIVRYKAYNEEDPKSTRNKYSRECSDETYSDLKPILRWKVPEISKLDDMVVQFANTTSAPYEPEKLGRWEVHKGPLWLNFSAPTLLGDRVESSKDWFSEMTVNTKASSDDQWVQILISATALPKTQKPALFPAVAHPIHLHGHDFALLAQCGGNKTHPCDPTKAVLKLDNPPRRDVALLPEYGYLIIAFKADNPGTWLMHCHIAWHASSGLAMQILENVDRIKLHNAPALNSMCAKWDDWYKNKRLLNPTCSSWCEDKNHCPFQDDSGI